MDSIRKEFEEAMKIPEGIYYSAHHKAYRSVNGRIYEQGQACDANLQLEGWVKSRESLVVELPSKPCYRGYAAYEYAMDDAKKAIHAAGIRTK